METKFSGKATGVEYLLALIWTRCGSLINSTQQRESHAGFAPLIVGRHRIDLEEKHELAVVWKQGIGNFCAQADASVQRAPSSWPRAGLVGAGWSGRRVG